MAKSHVPAPRVHQVLPPMNSVPLGTFIQQLNTPGLSPAAAKAAALAIHMSDPSGKGAK